MDRRRDGKNYIFYNQKDTVDFYTRIKANDYTVLRTLKDDRRSLVQLIRINGKRYVLKVPRKKQKKVAEISFYFQGGRKYKRVQTA